MAVRVWLDKDGKVLVSPEGNVYLSEECCCLKEPDPTVCWQLYSATVTTSEDGSSKGWSEPWMVDYTCLVSGSEPPGAAEWRYAQAGATRWVSFLGMCSECSVPHGADKPDLNPACTVSVYVITAGHGFSNLYMGVASVITYSVVRDADGLSVGQNVVGSTVVPNWLLTEVTPDDTDDFKYSQVLGEARLVRAPLFRDEALDGAKLDPYYYPARGSTWVTNSYVVYDGGRFYRPLANGASLGILKDADYYATRGQPPMWLTMVGSRYSAVAQVSIGMTTMSSRVCDWATIWANFGANEWGHVEFSWTCAGDTWYRPYIDMTAHRVALGGMTPVSECSRYERELPTYLVQSMAPLWREYLWVSNAFPLAQAADHALDLALSGVDYGLPRVSITAVKCNTWWFRLIGEAWDGCPVDAEVAFNGWTRLWSREDTPEYRYLDTLIPMTDSRVPYGADPYVPIHEDDDALAQGSTVFRPFSSELGDGHCYILYELSIHNFPSWRTDLCSTAFEPITAEVPNLIWRGTDIGKNGWWSSNSSAGAGGPWPVQSFWIRGSNSNGWYSSQLSLASIDDHYTRFIASVSVLPGTLYDGGDKLYVQQAYTVYDFAGGYQTVQLRPCIVITELTSHVPGALVGYEAVHWSRITAISQLTYDGEVVYLTTCYDLRYLAVAGTLDAIGLDGHGVELWRGCKYPLISATKPIVASVNPNLSHRLWLVDGMGTVCSQDRMDEFVEQITSCADGFLERFFSLNPTVPRDWWQVPLGYRGVYDSDYLIGSDINRNFTFLGTFGYASDFTTEWYSSCIDGNASWFYSFSINYCIGGSASMSIYVPYPSFVNLAQTVPLIDGYNKCAINGILSSFGSNHRTYSSRGKTTVYHNTHITVFTANYTLVAAEADNATYGTFSMFRLPLSSAAWAPTGKAVRVTNIVDVDYPDFDNIYGTYYYTNIYDESTRLVDANGHYVWSFNYSSTVSSLNTWRGLVLLDGYYKSTYVFVDPRTVGDWWSPPGLYDKIEAIVNPGKATVTSAIEFYGGTEDAQSTVSFRKVDVDTWWCEASIKGANN